MCKDLEEQHIWGWANSSVSLEQSVIVGEDVERNEGQITKALVYYIFGLPN